MAALAGVKGKSAYKGRGKKEHRKKRFEVRGLEKGGHYFLWKERERFLHGRARRKNLLPSIRKDIVSARASKGRGGKNSFLSFRGGHF